MSAFAGPADWWTEGTDQGRTHIATKGTVQSGLVLNLDAGVSGSYPGSGTTWTDLSGQANTGTLVNGPTFSSANGGSIVFDGVDDYVGTSFPLNGFNAFTVSCWFRLNVVNKNWQSIIDAYKDTNDRNFQLWVNFDRRLNIFHLGFPHTGDGLLEANVWYNAVFSYSGSGNGVLYLNNSVLNASVPKGAGSGGNINLNIGRRTDAAAPSYTNGNISKVTIYNRALSAAEVTQNFNAMRGRYGI